MATDSQVVYSIVGYFAILTVLLGTLGIAGPAVNVPDRGTVAEQSGKGETAVQASTGVLCLGSLGTAFFSLGFSLAISVVSCGAFAFSVFAPEEGVTAFRYIFGFLGLFFQIISLQLPVHPIIRLMLIVPPGAASVYLALGLMRGGK